ncbi:MAG: mercury resistance system periplasmic binding protein MerP [Nitrococcus mobilis]|nr:mercury resistance system periplasmic binding protein MerP [Nitrococcus mobilis]
MDTIHRVLLAACLVFALVLPAGAAEQTVTLDVDNMTCTSCPYIVKKSLTRVAGVTAAAVSFEEKTATVTFDDARAGITELSQATGEAGYPSRPRK